MVAMPGTPDAANALQAHLVFFFFFFFFFPPATVETPPSATRKRPGASGLWAALFTISWKLRLR